MDGVTDQVAISTWAAMARLAGRHSGSTRCSHEPSWKKLQSAVPVEGHGLVEDVFGDPRLDCSRRVLVDQLSLQPEVPSTQVEGIYPKT